MRVQLNGEPHETDCTTIAGLVASLGLDGQWVVVEQNLSVPEKAHWERTPLAQDDQIEIVRFLGGG